MEKLIRDGLLSFLDRKTTDLLLTAQPGVAEIIAAAVGEARLNAGMTPTALSAFAVGWLAAWGMNVHWSFGKPLPGYDIDAELARLKVLVMERLDGPQ